jgi:dihydrofolate reductase
MPRTVRRRRGLIELFEESVHVLKISMSLDCFVAGRNQSVDNPLGVGGMRLHEWAFPLKVWRAMHGLEGGEENESARVVEESFANIGATVMGRNMFVGPWDADPPFHHPVFVLTHHARKPLECEGGTTFTFVTDGIESALDQARRAAGGKDVSLARGCEGRPAISRSRARGPDGDQSRADAARQR